MRSNRKLSDIDCAVRRVRGCFACVIDTSGGKRKISKTKKRPLALNDPLHGDTAAGFLAMAISSFRKQKKKK